MGCHLSSCSSVLMPHQLGWQQALKATAVPNPSPAHKWLLRLRFPVWMKIKNHYKLTFRNQERGRNNHTHTGIWFLICPGNSEERRKYSCLGSNSWEFSPGITRAWRRGCICSTWLILLCLLPWLLSYIIDPMRLETMVQRSCVEWAKMKKKKQKQTISTVKLRNVNLHANSIRRWAGL